MKIEPDRNQIIRRSIQLSIEEARYVGGQARADVIDHAVGYGGRWGITRDEVLAEFDREIDRLVQHLQSLKETPADV